ncbi:hypothetical protein NFI96_001002 [Prochilodus magdalenae]|nr:hypothetical protein NFI96_001002 [Prochilodus magdalenae]
MAEKIIGVSLLTITDIYTTRCIRKATSSVGDHTHPSQTLFPPFYCLGKAGHPGTHGCEWNRAADNGFVEDYRVPDFDYDPPNTGPVVVNYSHDEPAATNRTPDNNFEPSTGSIPKPQIDPPTMDDDETLMEASKCAPTEDVDGQPLACGSNYGLRRAALHGEDEFGHAAKEFIHRQFYVDDGLISLPFAPEAINILKAARDMLAVSNLRLHKIASNCLAVMQAFPSSEYANDLKDLDLSIDSPPVQRNLGLNWNLSNDMFTFRVATTERPFTRRGVLATVNSLFDPLGLVAPISVQGKFLLRELTRNTVDRDEPLPPEREKDWMTWRESLQALEHFELLY